MNSHVFEPPASREIPKKLLPCPFTAESMLAPKEMQPPPMYGPRGPTIPAKHLAPYTQNNRRFNRPTMPRGKPSFPRQFQSPIRNRHNNFNVSTSKETRSTFWCEICDWDFETESQLSGHRQQHRKCNLDGCTFEAAEQILQKHIQQQHSSGLFEKIKNLSTPEEVAKWREERRKRYPTKENIAARQQAQEARFTRGERLVDSKSRFGRKSDRRSHHQEERKDRREQQQQQQQNKRKRTRKGKRVEKVEVTDSGSVEEKNKEEEKTDSLLKDSMNGPLPMFCGISQMEDYVKVAGKKVNALSSFLGMYESDESEYNDESDQEIIKTTKIEENNSENALDDVSYALEFKSITSIPLNQEEGNVNTPLNEVLIDKNKSINQEQLIESASSDNEPPDEQPIEHNLKQNEDSAEAPESEDAKPNTSSRRQRKRNHVTSSDNKPKKQTLLDLSKKYRNQNTMLEKLLQKDIRHERNVLLQCVRYVVENNFFGIGQDAKK